MSNAVTLPVDASPLVLLPPSEGKAPGGNDPPWDPGSGAFGTLGDQRRQIVEALVAADGGSQRLLGVKGDHLERALAANRDLLASSTLPAWKRYTGVVWSHLEPASLSAVARRRIVVVSGLLGLVRGDDPVPEYRLKMGVGLDPLGKLSTWWRDDVTVTLEQAARRRFVVDLLPKEHRAAFPRSWDLDGVAIGFVDPSGKPGGHFAKAAKGRLARQILSDGLGAVQRWEDDRFELTVAPLRGTE